MHDTIVVGAGLFGQIIAAHLRSLGQDVLVLDAGAPRSGSRPSACLMKPSWFSGLGSAVSDPALEVLDRLYGIQELSFRVGPLRVDSVKWVDPSRVLAPMFEPRTVDSVSRGLVTTRGDDGPRRHAAHHVVVAAGVWTNSLLLRSGLPEVRGLEGKMGLACVWSHRSINEPFIRPWAPYKQLIAFNCGGLGLWVGDGTAIKTANWTQEREDQSIRRCAGAVGLESQPHVIRGIRPYVPRARPCYLEEVAPDIWVATGGAKNGTIAAGWCAHRLGEEFS